MSDTFHASLRDAVAEARGRPLVMLNARPPAPIAAAPPVQRNVPPGKLKVERRTVVNVWLPLTPLWVLLSPVPMLLAPLLWLAPGRYRVQRPYRAVLAVGAVLLNTSGLKVDVDTPDALVRIRIY